MDIHVGPATYRDNTMAESKSQTMIYFEERLVHDAPATKLHNAPRYKTRVFIVKITPGDKLLRVERYANDQDKMEHAKEWASFEKKQAPVLEGTPLEAWPPINKIQVAEMKAMNVFTVEQLANLPDSAVQKFMGGQMFRRKAQDFIKASQDMSYVEKMKDSLKERDDQIKELQEQMKELMAKKKPGRKPKAVLDGANPT